MDTKTARLFAAATIIAIAFLAAPRPAHAAFRLGVDGIWVPLSADRVENKNTTLDSDHELASFGGAVHGTLGFEVFSVGLKVNYFNEGLEIEENGTRRNEIDINAMGRIGVPSTKLGLFAEAGASLSTDYEGLGYNVGLGGEYGIVKMPGITLNVGGEGQWVTLPADMNGLNTDNKSFRLLLFVGADFGF